MVYINDSTIVDLLGGQDNLSNANSTTAPTPFYLAVVPMMMAACALAVLGNCYILLCVPWLRTSTLTVNLLLSLGLAAADAWAALLILLGLLVNSYLPSVYNMNMGNWGVCYFLSFELVRLAGMITSILYLLALALNHWFSIINPLRYKTMVTVGMCKVVVVVLWTLPLATMFLSALVTPGQGFRGDSPDWCVVDFYFRFAFRAVVLVQFAAPLALMLIIYGYILRKLAMVRCACGPQETNSPGREPHTLLLPIKDSSRRYSRRNFSFRGSKSRDHSQGSASPNMNRMSMRINSKGNSVKSKVKAVTTTLLILGTFAVGWIPAVTVFSLVCVDCLVAKPRTSAIEPTLLNVNMAVNWFIILKLLFNPFIYAFRILEIRYALWYMHETRYGLRQMSVRVELPRRFRSLDLRRRTV